MGKLKRLLRFFTPFLILGYVIKESYQFILYKFVVMIEKGQILNKINSLIQKLRNINGT